MGRSVVAEENSLAYLQGFAQPDSYSIGLILGQSTGSRDYVIHLARTPPLASKSVEEEDSPGNSDTEDEREKPVIRSVKEINDSWVADHAKHVTRMLPGGVWVLGVFIVGPEDVFADSGSMNRIKSVLGKVTKTLAANRFLHGNGPSSEMLALHLNSKSNKYFCKSVESEKSSGAINTVDWKFQANPTRWHQLECQVDFDQVFPIGGDKIAQTLKTHLQEILSRVSANVEKAVCMIDGEMKDENELLDSVSKKKRGKPAAKDTQESKIMSVNLYVPCEPDVSEKELVVKECCGEMNFLGLLTSRVFLHQKATIAEAVKAVKEDIVRSLAARLEMHSDSLIEEEDGSPEERVTLHEPPRRVLVALPHSRVALSDYLFPGEGATEALISLRELLDLDVAEEDVLKDLETQADSNEMFNAELESALEPDATEKSLPQSSTPYLPLAACLAFSLFILVASLAVQYITAL